MSVKNKFK